MEYIIVLVVMLCVGLFWGFIINQKGIPILLQLFGIFLFTFPAACIAVMISLPLLDVFQPGLSDSLVFIKMEVLFILTGISGYWIGALIGFFIKFFINEWNKNKPEDEEK